jgi:hypothetical protein
MLFVIAGFTAFVLCGMYVMDTKVSEIKKGIAVFIGTLAILICYAGFVT